MNDTEDNRDAIGGQNKGVNLVIFEIVSTMRTDFSVNAMTLYQSMMTFFDVRLDRFAVLSAFALFAPFEVVADGPADNIPESVRRVPPLGVVVPDEMAGELQSGLDELGEVLRSLDELAEENPELEELIPDCEIYLKAVRDALQYQEFQKEGEFRTALAHLETGLTRARALKEGKEAFWLRQHGLVVRGFRSRIDGSVQPYGLEIPSSYNFDSPNATRLDFWFHGRGEKVNEVSFIQQRTTSAGKINPEDTIVLHPYARFSNANKFAGEIDCLEALAHASKFYRIDEDRILVRGFSMGGAACWQFAVHYADRWAAASPGAGFSETPDFLETFQGETLNPAWWEKKLWRWYDCTDVAINLSNLPTIAYSGEIDAQKQAADMMEKAMADAGLDLVHIVGPGMGHKYHPDSLLDIEDRLGKIARVGRDRVPTAVRLASYTLRYPSMHWVEIEKLSQHWERGEIDAEWAWPNAVFVEVSGIQQFRLNFEPGDCPLDVMREPIIEINGRGIAGPSVRSDRSWEVVCHMNEKGEWQASSTVDFEEEKGLRKKHGLQGPIDDAFMDSFVMVAPSGQCFHPNVSDWVANEMNHAITHWRQQFRGDARVIQDTEVSDVDIAEHNLVLWGDPKSNAILARIADQLPIQWTEDGVVAGGETFESKSHALAMIFPNPLNPEKYVVLNSGFTYREYDYLNNARQTPKLPDWAVIDITQPATSQWPGGISQAGFFGEMWEWKPPEE